ncbi:MAG: Gfo/Idh/MocA family oxidoreductase [Planctomycetota bacterium]
MSQEPNPKEPIRVGVVGLGMMGMTHLDAYTNQAHARVVAIADMDEARRTGQVKAGGNIEGQAQGGFDFGSVKQYADAADLIADPDVQLVDVCLPTPAHAKFAILALEAGKHVLIEKPLARTAEQAAQIVAAAERAPGLTMCAMCMRFWPGWTWLKDAVDQRTYGPVHAATFRRVAEHPGGAFYENGDACGGAILDLHIHDADFVQYLFGMPEAVTSVGYAKITDQPDHVATQYHFAGDAAPLVTAEGGWTMAKGFGFRMEYTVNFADATAVFDLAKPEPLTLYRPGEEPQAVALPEGMGYEHEIAYFLDRISRGETPDRVTLASAADSVRLIEAEARSVATGQRVAL